LVPDHSGKEAAKSKQNEGKSDSLENIKKRVQALNTVNQSNSTTPTITSKLPRGFGNEDEEWSAAGGSQAPV
jgi:hypothetical protein